MGKIQKAVEVQAGIGLLLEEAEKIKDLEERIEKVSDTFFSVADLEEDAFSELLRIITEEKGR